MTFETLTKNELEFYRSLWTKQGQEELRCFAIEGFRIVAEALTADSEYDVREILMDAVFAEKTFGEQIIKLSKSKEVSLRFIKRYQMKKILPTEAPQGVMAILSIPSRTDDARLCDFLTMKGIFVYLDGIQDPGNAGTLIRSAAAFDASGVIIGEGGARLFNPKVVRSTAGAFLHIPIIDFTHREHREIIERFVKAKFAIVASSAEPDATPISEFSLPKKMLLVMGNEGAGIRKSILDFATHKIAIPISSKIESLNAAVAGSIMLFYLSQK